MKTLFILFLISWTASMSGNIIPVQFKQLLQKYQKSSGVTMAFKKHAYFPLLKKNKTSQGALFLSKEKMLLKLRDHLKTQILFDGQKWWLMLTPPGEKQEVKAIQPDHNITLLFQAQAFFRHFRFISQKTKGRTQILNFQSQSPEAPLGSLSVQVENERMLKVWLTWRGSGNQEVFTFSNIQFNQKLSPTLFLRPRVSTTR